MFQFKLVEVSQTIDYGYKLLKPERLIPMTMSGKVFSFGRHATPEDRAKAAKSANKKVTFNLYNIEYILKFSIFMTLFCGLFLVFLTTVWFWKCVILFRSSLI